MRGLLVQFLLSLAESLRDLAPIIVVIGLFQVVVLGQPLSDPSDLLWGTYRPDDDGSEPVCAGAKAGTVPTG